jgi:hypothetical protein
VKVGEAGGGTLNFRRSGAIEADTFVLPTIQSTIESLMRVQMIHSLCERRSTKSKSSWLRTYMENAVY